jgi:hypothetical protein
MLILKKQYKLPGVDMLPAGDQTEIGEKVFRVELCLGKVF